MRTRRALSVVAMTLGLVLTACGGDGDSSSDPSPSESPETESPSPSPSETEEAGPPKQPKGQHGVTYHIQNWDEYAEEPAVLAWKQAWEAYAGSVNQGEVLPALSRTTAGQVRRDLVAEAGQMHEQDLQMKDVGRIRVQNVREQGQNARVVVCAWGPSVSVYRQNGEEYEPKEPVWVRLTSDMRSQGGEWRMTSFQYGDPCSEGGSQ